MPTLSEVRAAVDSRLLALWDVIKAKQEVYSGNHGGRYWQGLITHSVIPGDGNEAPPDIGTRCPDDQEEEPYPLAIRTAALPMAIQIDVYNGPRGAGYVATVYVGFGGVVYTRAAQEGPERWRQYGWRRISNGAP